MDSALRWHKGALSPSYSLCIILIENIHIIINNMAKLLDRYNTPLARRRDFTK